ncbi:MAG: hypothetical protein E6G06_21795 [Actinobacteria bacterium]|nr:MAG: hypothetical protein E6G06_21795 [Actinomycetota bacterium]
MDDLITAPELPLGARGGHDVHMDTAQKILVVYGTLSLGYGFVLGIPISQSRMRSPEASRHLVIAHLSAIIQGAVHFGLSVALGLSQLTAWLETASALLLITGSALFVAGGTTNWLQGVGDHFAERSLGWKLFAASSIGHLSGISIVIVGVVAQV